VDWPCEGRHGATLLAQCASAARRCARRMWDQARSRGIHHHATSLWLARVSQVAKVAPSGAYCASADVSGVVKIWALDNPERCARGTSRGAPGRRSRRAHQ